MSPATSPSELLRNEVLPLFLAMRRHGPASPLPVEEAAGLRAPGLVEEVMPGPYRGFIDRFVPVNQNASVSLDSWLSVLAGARALIHGAGN